MTASVTFTGDATTTASFGRGVAFIGDIDDDGWRIWRSAIAERPPHIYIYKGRPTWPAAMSQHGRQLRHHRGRDATTVRSSARAWRAWETSTATASTTSRSAQTCSAARRMSGRVVIILGRVGFRQLRAAERGELHRHRRRSCGGDAAVWLPRCRSGTLLCRNRHHPHRVGAGEHRLGDRERRPIYAFHGQTGTAGAISSATANHVAVGPDRQQPHRRGAGEPGSDGEHAALGRQRQSRSNV